MAKGREGIRKLAARLMEIDRVNTHWGLCIGSRFSIYVCCYFHPGFLVRNTRVFLVRNPGVLGVKNPGILG